VFTGIITDFSRVCIRTQYGAKLGGGGVTGCEVGVDELPQLSACAGPCAERNSLSFDYTDRVSCTLGTDYVRCFAF
jgi:hypothetical protein